MKMKMKKIISTFLLVCILALSFVSCGDNNKGNTNVVPENTTVIPEKTDVEIVEELIDSINSAETCGIAADKYFWLDSAKERQVSNYSKLEAEVIKYSNSSEVSSYFRDWILKKPAEKVFKKYHEELKNNLSNISSYTVNEQTTQVYKSDTNWYLKITIDYSAQNKMGGYTRYKDKYRYYKWNGSDWKEISIFDIDEDKYPYGRFNFTY